MDPKRLAPGLGTAPFVKSVSRHDAAPLLKRLAERRQLVHGLRFRVDAHRSPAGVLRPTIHQAPGRRDRFAVLVLGFEDEVGLRRSDIEPWCVIAEFAFGYAEHGRQLGPVAPRHGESTAHISCPSRATRAIDSSRSSLPVNGDSLPASARSPVRRTICSISGCFTLTVIGV